MGVVSGDGMRLKARNDRPRLPGTYPPPRPEAGDREKLSKTRDWLIGGSYRRGQGDSCGEWGEGVFARASIEYMAAGWTIGGGYGIRADYEKIIHANY